jgi:hypothetical protein
MIIIIYQQSHPSLTRLTQPTQQQAARWLETGGLTCLEPFMQQAARW